MGEGGVVRGGGEGRGEMRTRDKHRRPLFRLVSACVMLASSQIERHLHMMT